MRFLVSCGMERADGASFRTAETVPGVSPTCWATTLRVTTADFWRNFLICRMSEIVSSLAQHPDLGCQTTLYQKRTLSKCKCSKLFSRRTHSSISNESQSFPVEGTG